MAIDALFHRAFIDRVKRHAANAMGGYLAARSSIDIVASHTAHISPVDAHVDIELTRGVGQGHGEIAMFDVVAATGVGVTGDTIAATRDSIIVANALGNDLQLD